MRQGIIDSPKSPEGRIRQRRPVVGSTTPLFFGPPEGRDETMRHSSARNDAQAQIQTPKKPRAVGVSLCAAGDPCTPSPVKRRKAVSPSGVVRVPTAEAEVEADDSVGSHAAPVQSDCERTYYVTDEAQILAEISDARYDELAEKYALLAEHFKKEPEFLRKMEKGLDDKQAEIAALHADIETLRSKNAALSAQNDELEKFAAAQALFQLGQPLTHDQQTQTPRLFKPRPCDVASPSESGVESPDFHSSSDDEVTRGVKNI